MRRIERLYRSERGATFVQVGISVFVLMAFNVFVIDYGVMWIGRQQAQNAADAGALAGAVSRAYDDAGSPPVANGIADKSARFLATVAANEIWQDPPAVNVSWACPPGITGRCAQVDVYRDAAHGNPLNTFFGPILGISTQGVWATATAIVRYGNTVPCLRPLAFADEWTENTVSPATTYPNHVFERYAMVGGSLNTVLNADVYVPPSSTVAGSTTWPTDLGERIVYQLGLNPLTSPITRQLAVGVRLPTAAAGQVGTYTEDCTSDIVHIGDTLRVELPAPTAGEITTALSSLILDDTAVTWNDTLHRIEDSCAPGTCSPRVPLSPRVIPVPLYDPDLFQKGRLTGHWAPVGCPNDAIPCITVTNIVGFFIHAPVPAEPTAHGHILRYPGLIDTSKPLLTETASWLVNPQLVR